MPNNGVGLFCSRRRGSAAHKHDASFLCLTFTFNLFIWKLSFHLLVPWGTSAPILIFFYDFSTFFLVSSYKPVRYRRTDRRARRTMRPIGWPHNNRHFQRLYSPETAKIGKLWGLIIISGFVQPLPLPYVLGSLHEMKCNTTIKHNVTIMQNF